MWYATFIVLLMSTTNILADAANLTILDDHLKPSTTSAIVTAESFQVVSAFAAAR
jgi:hypothetical protein